MSSAGVDPRVGRAENQGHLVLKDKNSDLLALGMSVGMKGVNKLSLFSNRTVGQMAGIMSAYVDESRSQIH